MKFFTVAAVGLPVALLALVAGRLLSTLGPGVGRKIADRADTDAATARIASKLLAIEEIKQLKARYFRNLDTKNWGELGTAFAEDAIFDTRAANSTRHPVTREWTPPLSGDERVFRGRQVIVDMIRTSVGNLYTVHHGHVPEIAILSATEARAVWPMQDILRYAEGTPLSASSGHYKESYEKDGSEWRIKTSVLSKLLIDGELDIRAGDDRPTPGIGEAL